MNDARLITLAHILVDKSIKVQPMEKVWVRVTDPVGLPLAREVYKAVVQAGGMPFLDIGVESLSSWWFQNANEAQLTAEPKMYAFQVNHFDKSIVIAADVNKSDMINVDPKRLQVRAKIMEPYKNILTNKPWVLTDYPTSAMAQAANMNLEDLEDFYFSSTNQDWTAIEKEMKRLADVLTDKDIEVVGEKTHLKLKTKGRKWVYDDWKANIPGGEVFTAPVDDSVEGEVYFNYPLTRQGVTMRDIHLTFEKGKVVHASASDNQAYLEHILDTDAGARRLGEFAIGGNPGVTKYMNNVLFDEKMKGTIHMALGFAFEDCGGINKSAIHMDMIKDMRPNGSELRANGKIILKHGQFLKI
jgi:aminopeptidase